MFIFSHEKNTLSFKPLKVVKNCPNIKDLYKKKMYQNSTLNSAMHDG
jgi:hypothetical protein